MSKPLPPKEVLEAHHKISTEQDERLFAATKDLIALVAEHGIESVEVGGIKIKNGFLSRPRKPAALSDKDAFVISKEDAKALQEAGHVDLVDPLDTDPYADPDLYASADGGTPPPNGGVN